MKVIGWLAGIGTLLAGGLYMVVSLNRWEWNRALFFGLIVLIAEVGLATGLVLRRLARLEYRLGRAEDPEVRNILSETRPPSRIVITSTLSPRRATTWTPSRTRVRSSEARRPSELATVTRRRASE